MRSLVGIPTVGEKPVTRRETNMIESTSQRRWLKPDPRFSPLWWGTFGLYGLLFFTWFLVRALVSPLSEVAAAIAFAYLMMILVGWFVSGLSVVEKVRRIGSRIFPIIAISHGITGAALAVGLLSPRTLEWRGLSLVVILPLVWTILILASWASFRLYGARVSARDLGGV
jgi:hypothetical protein